jgi:CopG family nickel-responsive transcriptional regulator
MGHTARFGVSIPQELVKAFDERVQRKGYRTRSEAIRDIMREYIVNEAWESERGEVVGTVTIVYDHERRELTHVLTELQHHFQSAIACSTHVHLDEHNCLEVIVLRGKAAHVQTIADRLISTKGVKHGKLVCTTTGANLV